MKRNRLCKSIFSVAIIIPLLSFIGSGETGEVVAKKDADATQAEEAKINDNEIMNAQPLKLSKKQVKRKANQFMELLDQDIGADNKVKHMDSKKELIQSLKHVANRETAKKFVDMYYKEQHGELYIIPTDKPAWIDEEGDLDMIQLDNKRVKAVQRNQSDLHREYTIAIEFTYDQEWVISDVDYL